MFPRGKAHATIVGHQTGERLQLEAELCFPEGHILIERISDRRHRDLLPNLYKFICGISDRRLPISVRNS